MSTVKTTLLMGLFFTLSFATELKAQCVLSSGNVAQSAVLSCLTACSCNTLIIPNGVTVDMNGSWDLTSAGDITLIINGSGSLIMSKTGNNVDKLTMTGGSSIMITNTSNTSAISFSGSGNGIIIITVGTTTINVGALGELIASGGFNNAPLPIELTNFEAKRLSKNKIQVNWTTASEKNNQGFKIERSIDGKDWTERAWITGAGETTQEANYQFEDEAKSDQSFYYRLRQIDFDAVETLTQIIHVKASTSTTVSFYPNPAEAEITFSNIDEIQAINLFDMTGKRVLSVEDINSNQLNINQLVNGIYIMRVQMTNGTSSVQRLIKQ